MSQYQNPQGFSGPVPPQGYTGQVPPQGYTGQMPPQGYTGQMPTQGYSGPIPTQGYSGPIPPQGYAGQPPENGGAPNGENEPPAGFRYRDNREPPKQRMSLLQIALIVAALAVTGIYAWSSFAPQAARYGVIEAQDMGETHTGEALIARNEIPFDTESVTNIDMDAEEGAYVRIQDKICRVFSSGYSTREMTALQDYRDQIRDYQKGLLEQETTYDARMARVESDVLTRTREVREMMAGAKGNLNVQQEMLETAIDARQQYLRQKYSADQRLTRLYDDESAQEQKIDSWTKTFLASRDGIVSFYSDGYEYGLTASNCGDFRPQDVRRMIRGEKPPEANASKTRTTIFRIVLDTPWYVLMLADDDDWNPEKGRSYALSLEDDAVVQATVESFEHSGGELLVRLRVDSMVRDVLTKRACKAELVDGARLLKVPARAIYRQDEMDGVVIVDGGLQSFVPVTILRREGDTVYISPVTQGLLYEGMTIRLF